MSALDTFHQLQTLMVEMVLFGGGENEAVNGSNGLWWRGSDHVNSIYELYPKDISLFETFAAKSAQMLQATSPVKYDFPSSMIGDKPSLSIRVEELLKPLVNNGIQITSYHNLVRAEINKAIAMALKNDWNTALKIYSQILEKVPEEDKIVR